MSSDQVPEKPLPPAQKECARCGELMPVEAPRCWLCLEPFSSNEAGPPGRRDLRNRSTALGRAAWITLAILGVLIGVVLAIEAPGVLMGLLLVAGVILGLIEVSRSRSRTPREPDNSTLVSSGAGLTAGIVLFFLTSFIAFVAICSPYLIYAYGW